MPQPLLDFLEGRAKSALPFLRAGVDQGLSPTAIINSLRPLNLTFTRQRMLDVISALYNKADLNRYLRIVPPNTPLPSEAHTTNAAPQGANYQYVVSGLDRKTDEESFVTINSDIPLSQNNIFAKAQTYFLGIGESAIGETQFFASVQSIVEANVSDEVPF